MEVAMRDIDPEEAAAEHGITVRHQEMDNGEFRFRLLKQDGTAYIRTEASENGAWQSSHYHNLIKETYIVQRGWIAYAELINDNRKISVYRAGDLFTTQPRIVHNVYMPANAVIHTVKHGEADNEDRITNETTREFDKDIKVLTVEQILLESVGDQAQKCDRTPEETYTAEYRHFDNLIWQLPAWCTAIFLLAIVGMSAIDRTNLLMELKILTKNQIATGFLGLMFVVILILTHALFRFRVHQSKLKRYSPTAIWKSASSWLQFVVTGEAFALLLVLILINGFSVSAAFWVCAGLLVALTAYRESALRRHSG